MPASQISAKLLGGPRKGQPKSKKPKGPLVLSPAQLGDITLDKEAYQALTSAKLEVVIRLSQGSRSAHLENSKGEKVGGLDDLAKIYSMRSFVAKEKKHSASEEVRQEVIQTAYKASVFNTGAEDYIQPKLDNSYIVTAKPYRAMLETALKHKNAIAANYGTEDKGLQETLVVYSHRFYNAIEKTIADLTAGKKEKGLLDGHCFNEGLPSYFKTKLGIKSLGLTNDVGLDRIVFPQDPSKGFSLTTKEWMDTSFLQKQGTLLRNSLFLKKIFESVQLVQSLSALSEEQWENAEDPRTQRVMKQRFLVIPTAGHERILEPLVRQNFRGFALPSTAMDQSKDRLANLAAVPIRAYALSIRMAETIADFYDRFTPAGTIKPVDDKLGNYAKQLKTFLDGGGVSQLMDIITLRTKPDAMVHWINRECKIIPGSDLSREITRALGFNPGELKDASKVAPTTLPVQLAVIPFVNIDGMGYIFESCEAPKTDTEREAIAKFEKTTFYGNKKEDKKKRSEAASVLTKPAKAFVKYIRGAHSKPLADSMEAYFRGFYSSEMQIAAVNLALAKFDEIEEVLETSDEDSSHEESEEEDDE